MHQFHTAFNRIQPRYPTVASLICDATFASNDCTAMFSAGEKLLR
jgi:hypothetical protein